MLKPGAERPSDQTFCAGNKGYLTILLGKCMQSTRIWLLYIHKSKRLQIAMLHSVQQARNEFKKTLRASDEDSQLKVWFPP